MGILVARRVAPSLHTFRGCERGFQPRSRRAAERAWRQRVNSTRTEDSTVHAQKKSLNWLTRYSSVERGSVGSDSAADGLEGSALKSVRFWESDVLRGVLADLFAADLRVVQDAGTDDLDGVLSGAMATGHLHVHLRDGTAEGHISVLLVHVNGTRAGQVAKNDTVVPDSASLLLEDLTGGDDFTLNFANLVLSLHVVPELGPGKNGVPLEDTHSVEGRVRVRLRGEGTTHDVELSQLSKMNTT